MSQVVNVIGGIGSFYALLIFVYVLMSWFPIGGSLSDLYKVLGSVVDPYLNLFRRFLPPMGNVDISPIVAFFVLRIILVPGLQMVARALVR